MNKKERVSSKTKKITIEKGQNLTEEQIREVEEAMKKI